MKLYKVYGKTEVFLEAEIEAESKEDAIRQAEKLCDALTSYCGYGGGTDKLVGTDEEEISIDPADFVEWHDAELYE